jgi:hypothetical protein
MKVSQQKKQYINPFEALENKSHQKSGEIPNLPDMMQSPENIKKMGNFSPMDLEKLNEAYANQDQESLDELRKNMTPEQKKEQEKVHFFKRYKREEEEYYYKRKQEEEEKKRQEAEEEFQKKRQAEQEQMSQQGGDLPQGKIRKNIFGGGKQKTNMRIPPPSNTENKPNKGSQ